MTTRRARIVASLALAGLSHLPAPALVAQAGRFQPMAFAPGRYTLAGRGGIRVPALCLDETKDTPTRAVRFTRFAGDVRVVRTLNGTSVSRPLPEVSGRWVNVLGDNSSGSLRVELVNPSDRARYELVVGDGATSFAATSADVLSSVSRKLITRESVLGSLRDAFRAASTADDAGYREVMEDEHQSLVWRAMSAGGTEELQAVKREGEAWGSVRRAIERERASLKAETGSARLDALYLTAVQRELRSRYGTGVAIAAVPARARARMAPPEVDAWAGLPGARDVLDLWLGEALTDGELAAFSRLTGRDWSRRSAEFEGAILVRDVDSRWQVSDASGIRLTATTDEELGRTLPALLTTIGAPRRVLVDDVLPAEARNALHDHGLRFYTTVRTAAALERSTKRVGPVILAASEDADVAAQLLEADPSAVRPSLEAVKRMPFVRVADTREKLNALLADAKRAGTMPVVVFHSGRRGIMYANPMSMRELADACGGGIALTCDFVPTNALPVGSTGKLDLLTTLRALEELRWDDAGLFGGGGGKPPSAPPPLSSGPPNDPPRGPGGFAGAFADSYARKDQEGRSGKPVLFLFLAGVGFLAFVILRQDDEQP